MPGNEKPELSKVPRRERLATHSLPVAWTLSAVELTRHWDTPAVNIYAMGTAVFALFWLFSLRDRHTWTYRHTGTAIDGVILSFAAVTGIAALFGATSLAETLSGSIIYCLPAICIWWAISQYMHPLRMIACLLGLVICLWPFVQTSTYQFFELGVLCILLILTIRLAVRNMPSLFSTPHAEKSHVSLRDPLTGLASAAYFEAELAHMAAIADRYRVPFSLIACEILDESPQRSAQAGHIEDEFLKSFAWALSDGLRIADTVCRWEHRKFFVLLPNTSGDRAELIAHKLEQRGETMLLSSGKNFSFRCAHGEHQFGEDPMLSFSSVDNMLATHRPSGRTTQA